MKCYFCPNFDLGWCNRYDMFLSEELIEDNHDCTGYHESMDSNDREDGSY